MALNSPIDIEGIYNDYLDKKQEENRLKRYSGKESWYHASGAGSCSRKLYFESVEKVKPSNPFGTTVKRLLRLGNVLHDDFEKALLSYNRDNNIHNRENNRDNNREKEIKNKEIWKKFKGTSYLLGFNSVNECLNHLIDDCVKRGNNGVK